VGQGQAEMLTHRNIHYARGGPLVGALDELRKSAVDGDSCGEQEAEGELFEHVI